MADIKELIPEFFYLPDFLTNDNHFDLGMMLFYIVVLKCELFSGIIVFLFAQDLNKAVKNLAVFFSHPGQKMIQ